MQNDASPLWLQILIASIPLLAAAIGGIFLLTNTINRRVERLKNLVDASKSNLLGVKGDHILRDIIVQQLMDLWHDTTPALKWRKRLRYIVFVSTPIVYTLIASRMLGISLGLTPTQYSWTLNAFATVSVILIIAAFIVRRKSGAYLDNTLDKFASLDSPDQDTAPTADQRRTEVQAEHHDLPAQDDSEADELVDASSTPSPVTRFPALCSSLAVGIAVTGIAGWAVTRLARRR
ncbi:hypothetical protein DAVIS_04690 [Mycobacterium marinum]|uniref:Uncharacterized protein n=1 Tax=Mycobacterium marinum TaxID=1781 RepID=A0A3E2MQU9_MYCMR|nr:hypothetical protein [Mycobacterium marinum]RFZ35140.1 hypothetical protein DAVIS_04690 [Mycobacterium marinum]